jgi:hypothetical protein
MCTDKVAGYRRCQTRQIVKPSNWKRGPELLDQKSIICGTAAALPMPDRNMAIVALRYNGDDNTCWKEEDDFDEEKAKTCMIFSQKPAEK